MRSKMTQIDFSEGALLKLTFPVITDEIRGEVTNGVIYVKVLKRMAFMVDLEIQVPGLPKTVMDTDELQAFYLPINVPELPDYTYQTLVDGHAGRPIKLKHPIRMRFQAGDYVAEYGRIVDIGDRFIVFDSEERCKRREDMMEKRGVIDENTPQAEPKTCDDCDCRKKGEPTTKEAADALEQHPVNDLVDAVAEKTEENKK